MCELARRIFGKVSNCRLLVVGAGEVAESAMEALNPVIQRPSPLLAELLIGVRLAGENRMN